VTNHKPLLTGLVQSGPGFGKNIELYEPVQFRLFEKGAKKPDRTGPEGTN
jgi:hypothetical protein